MNIKRYFKILLNKWYVIALFVLLCMVVAVCFSYFARSSEYQSDGKLFISSVTTEGDAVVDNTTAVINNIIDIAKSEAVLTDVMNDPALQVLGYSVNELNESLDIVRTTSGIIVRCSTINATHSQIVVKAYLNSGVPRIQSIVAMNSTHKFNYTVVGEPLEGVKAKEMIIGAAIIAIFAGIIIGSLVVVMPYLMNKRPNNSEYLAEDYECKVLAELPLQCGKSEEQY